MSAVLAWDTRYPAREQKIDRLIGRLLEKQKERMKSLGAVNIPHKAFGEVLKI